VSSQKSLIGKKPKIKKAIKPVSQRPASKGTLSKKLEASFAEAGYQKPQKPNPAPYAIKKQRAERDARHAQPRPAQDKKHSAPNVLRSELLDKFPWLLHGFSTRTGGVSNEYGGHALNLGITHEDTKTNVQRNRELFKQAVGAVDHSKNSWPLLNLKQIHSAIIHRVDHSGEGVTAGDGLITNAPGVLLAVKTADCFPVIVVDLVRHAVGVFHAGWRGTVQRIVEKGIGEFRRQFGSDPKDLLAVIGPGIGPCCYEVGDEVVDEFATQFAYSPELFEEVFDSHSLHLKYPLLFLNQRAPGHGDAAARPHLDLVKANRYQLRDAGLPAQNISALEQCTACRTDLFFSHRVERATGRMMAVVGIRE